MTERNDEPWWREFRIDKDPIDIGCDMYARNSFRLKEGLTVLVGCNGSGKTTLLYLLEDILNENDVPVIMCNLQDGSNSTLSASVLGGGDVAMFATAVTSSEGERRSLDLSYAAKKAGVFARKNQDADELWFLFDAADSGCSIDNIMDIKKYLFHTILEHTQDKHVFVVASANSFEMCNGEEMFDAAGCRYVTNKIKNYEDYRKFILKSRERKDARDGGAK